eukprot:TRINITY_DN102576_c0_g1_i1.p2 TRINITY_DN102576_c0_g1~~TRINITY_DN102576_c0_g1_i1.p2  ORF type:complete len:249 (-),score=51.88 TRINITY_DN102576_c0_g1_i1:121-867(-)
MTMRARLMPPDDYLRGNNFSHESNPQAYPWLVPISNRQQQKMRDGPCRADFGFHTREHQEFINREPNPAGHSLAPRPFVAKAKSRGKRPDIALWPVGCPEPQFHPLSAEEQEFRGAVMNAVRAANAVRGGAPAMPGMRKSASVPGPRARRKAEAAAAASSAQLAAAVRKHKKQSGEIVDDIRPIDSISQAPSVQHDEASLYEDVMSAETMTDSRVYMPRNQRLEREMNDALSRNRQGHYNWHGGRLLG